MKVRIVAIDTWGHPQPHGEAMSVSEAEELVMSLPDKGTAHCECGASFAGRSTKNDPWRGLREHLKNEHNEGDDDYAGTTIEEVFEDSGRDIDPALGQLDADDVPGLGVG